MRRARTSEAPGGATTVQRVTRGSSAAAGPTMPFFMLVIVNLVILATSVWVVFDSRDRDFSHSRIAKGRAQWIVGSFLLWIVAFPAYLMIRDRSPKSGSAGSAAPAPTPMASMVPPHYATSVPPPDRGTPPAA